MCIAGVAIYSCDAVLPPFFQGCSMHHDNRPEQDLWEKRGWSTHVFFTAVKCTGNPRSWICSVCLHLKELVALKFQSVFQLSLAGWLVDACSDLSSFISSSFSIGYIGYGLFTGQRRKGDQRRSDGEDLGRVVESSHNSMWNESVGKI